MTRLKLFVVYSVLLVGLLLAALLPTGCGNMNLDTVREQIQRVSEQTDDVQQAIAAAAERKADLDTQIAAMPPGTDRDRHVVVSEKLGEVIEAGQSFLGEAEVSLSRLGELMADATDDVDAFEATYQTTAEMLPPPWGGYLALGGGLIAALWRAAKNRQTARNIATSMEGRVTVNTDERATVSGIQGAAGRRIVDEAQGKRTKLPI